jgi:pimeloyl-ACP methyl ester carboxylesterase
MNMKSLLANLAMSPLLLCLLLSATPAVGQETVGPHNRAEAVKIVADLRKIVTPNGAERLEKIRINKIDQWVSIRSHDLRNPVLLFIHGGPGWVAMPSSWYFAHGWEEYFTVIQWDQRGAGKTYTANDPASIAPTMTIDSMVADTEAIAEWARKEFGKQKIFVAGHSWGSILGLMLTQRHPDWLHAYIGMGQAVDARESERRGWAWTLARARTAGNAEAVRDLESIAPYASGNAPIALKSIMLQRKWLDLYGGAVFNRGDASAEASAFKLSPDYTDEDVRQVWKAQDLSADRLLTAVLDVNLSNVRKLETPLILFLGRHDINVSSEVAAEWFSKVSAPSKRIVWFENSAHHMMTEEPGKTLLSLVKYARPIAERAGDVAPNDAEFEKSTPIP